MSPMVADALDAELTRRVDGAGPHRGRPRRAGAPPGPPAARRRRPDRHHGARAWAPRPELLPRLCGPTSPTTATSVAAACAVRTRRPARRARVGGAARAARGVARWRAAAPGRDDRRSASWPSGWTSRFREVVGVLEPRRPCTSPRWPGSARSPSGCATPRSAGANCWSPTTRTPPRSTALATAVDARLATCTNDPLSLPARLPRDLATAWPRTSTAARRDRGAGWRSWRRSATAGPAAGARPPTRSRRSTRCAAREAQARGEALDRVAGTACRAARPRPALRRRLAALPDRSRPDAAALAALPRLVADVAAAPTPCAPHSGGPPG